MWLILCNAKDTTALWAYRGLKARGLRPLEIISAEALVYSTCLKHRIESNNVSTRIKLTDGRVLDSASVRGTLNRIEYLPSEHLLAADSVDRQYAEQELHALFVSWLYALPGTVINRSSPQGLSGAWMHQSKWLWLASQAGLSTPFYRGGAMIGEDATLPQLLRQTVIVLAGRCFGAPVPENVRRGCAKLAQLCQVETLGIDFKVESNGKWTFASATPVPEIRLGGEPLLDAVVETLMK